MPIVMGTRREPPPGDLLIRLRPLPIDVISRVLEKNSGIDHEARGWIAAQTGGYIKLAVFIANEMSKGLDLNNLITTVENLSER